jgi:carbon storage regulator
LVFKEEFVMLVLSRKVGERIVIGDNVSVVINRIVGNRVSVGVEAPPEVRIRRGELIPFADERADQPASSGTGSSPTFDLPDAAPLQRAR